MTERASSCASCGARFARRKATRARVLAATLEPVATDFESRIMAAAFRRREPLRMRRLAARVADVAARVGALRQGWGPRSHAPAALPSAALVRCRGEPFARALRRCAGLERQPRVEVDRGTRGGIVELTRERRPRRAWRSLGRCGLGGSHAADRGKPDRHRDARRREPLPGGLAQARGAHDERASRGAPARRARARASAGNPGRRSRCLGARRPAPGNTFSVTVISIEREQGLRPRNAAQAARPKHAGKRNPNIDRREW